MHLVVIMDPPQTVILQADTSYALMVEARKRGHQLDHCLISDLFLHRSRLGAWVRAATPQHDESTPIVLGKTRSVWLDEVDVVMIRKDPPFDPRYLWTTLLLEHIRTKTLIVNDPRGLREANEKLFACNFPELMPETMVTSHAGSIRDFVRDVGGHAVIKPLDGAGGSGVMALRHSDPNFNAIVETATANGTQLAMVQRYLEAITQGDKRVLLLDGEPLGALLRLPQSGDLRSNLHVGGKAAAAQLDDRDFHIIDALRDALKQNGLYFVGIDIIGGKLTEVNVTSPTGIQQMTRLMKENLSGRVIDWFEAKL